MSISYIWQILVHELVRKEDPQWLFSLLFYVYEYFACVFLCVHHMYSMPVEARRQKMMSDTLELNSNELLCVAWEVKSRLSRRAGSAVMNWATSPTALLIFVWILFYICAFFFNMRHRLLLLSSFFIFSSFCYHFSIILFLRALYMSAVSVIFFPL